MRALIAFVAILLWQTIALSLEPLTVQMLDISNSLRERARQPIAALDPCLCSAAQSHAAYLASRGFGVTGGGDPHSGYGDGTPTQRASAHGFTGTLLMPRDASGWNTVGEIIAPRYTADVNSPFQGWLSSSGHRKSLLYGGFNRCGFGHARNQRGESIFVALYGTEFRPAASAPAAFQVSGGPVQGPQQTPQQAPAKGYVQAPMATCGPNGCGTAAYGRAYYQPRRGVRVFGGCGGSGRYGIVRRMFRR